MSRADILQSILHVIVLVLSLTVHEWAHAYSAYKLGDDTAARLGRLTLNPLAHIDPVGSILLPLLHIPFGWAKPVPVNPAKFSRRVTMKTGMAITAFAGPASNFVLAFAAAVALGLLLRFRLLPMETGTSAGFSVYYTLMMVVTMNVGLGVFNLLPIPPLDGSRLLERAIGYRYPNVWAQIERFGQYGLILAFFVGGRLLAVPIGLLTDGLFRVTVAIVGGA